VVGKKGIPAATTTPSEEDSILMRKVMVFIDGSWLYRSRLLLQQEYPSAEYKLDYGKIPSVILKRLSEELGIDPGDMDLVRTHLFGSIPVNVAEEDREKIERQDSFYKLLREKYHYETEVFSIDFGGRALSQRHDNGGGGWIPREKCVDIALASTMLYLAAIPGAYDIGVLVAGDLDYKPMLRRTRLLGKRIMIVGVRGTTCREFLVQDNKDQIRDFDVLFLNDYLDELELKMETRKYNCGRCGKVFYTDYQPRNGQKVFCDDCRGVSQAISSYGQRYSGRVKVWKAEEGYGFIERPNGPDVFVHISQLQENGIEGLTPGQPIQFEIEETTRGPQARNVDIQPVSNDIHPMST
jgi:CspA family cold shock protein